MKEVRLKGNYMGGVLIYGYKKDGKKVVIDEAKAEIIRYIYDEYLHGMYIKTIIKNHL
jgi:DNA invertase Pin-like site-specific DNA recombinase